MELFGKPIFFIYFLLAAGLAAAVLALGKARKNRIIRALFGAGAYQKLTHALRLNHTVNTCFLFAGLFFLSFL